MTSPRFVVQRHRASRLHYDFRLEVGGSLASWAVPKGPTLDPKARQLAVRVEDHSLEYFDFEGVIPKGQYGGGDVIVWDWGTWQPAENTNPADAIKRGELHFDVRGEKLAGRFVLVRTGRDKRDRDKWLLIHKNDDHARRGWNPEDLPRSVKSGRTNDEIAGQWVAPSPDELAALDDLDREGSWHIGGRAVRLTNLDKVLFPGPDPLTKRDLIRYYARIGPYMVPYLEGRPVNANRFPDGVTAHGFWHKEIPDHAPDWITRWYNTEADDDETHCYAVLDSVPSLVWMANFAGIELHPWTSRLTDVHQPTWALVDIDPGSRTTFDEIVEMARLYRTALDHLGMAGMPKVTGKRGIQIWIPVRAGYTFADTRNWVETVSKVVGRIVPKLISWEWYRNQRGGLARLDYTQNAINKTLVAPFSVRPTPTASVSVPIAWDELDDPELRPDRWTIRTVLDRIAEKGDPMGPLIGKQQEIPAF